MQTDLELLRQKVQLLERIKVLDGNNGATTSLTIQQINNPQCYTVTNNNVHHLVGSPPVNSSFCEDQQAHARHGDLDPRRRRAGLQLTNTNANIPQELYQSSSSLSSFTTAEKSIEDSSPELADLRRQVQLMTARLLIEQSEKKSLMEELSAFKSCNPFIVTEELDSMRKQVLALNNRNLALSSEFNEFKLNASNEITMLLDKIKSVSIANFEVTNKLSSFEESKRGLQQELDRVSSRCAVIQAELESLDQDHDEMQQENVSMATQYVALSKLNDEITAENKRLLDAMEDLKFQHMANIMEMKNDSDELRFFFLQAEDNVRELKSANAVLMDEVASLQTQLTIITITPIALIMLPS